MRGLGVNGASEIKEPTGCIKVVDDRNDDHHCYDYY